MTQTNLSQSVFHRGHFKPEEAFMQSFNEYYDRFTTPDSTGLTNHELYLLLCAMCSIYEAQKTEIKLLRGALNGKS